MSNTTTDQTLSEKGQDDGESIPDNQDVAWYARGDGEVFDADACDTPVRVAEVYELLSVILSDAPVGRFDPRLEYIAEVTSHRAWPGLIEWVRSIDCDAHLCEREVSS
jgi:hypothetical protein